MSIGMAHLGTSECSLFVVNYNDRAIKCYKSLGFKNHEYPPNQEYYSDIEFMVYKNA